MDWSKIKEGDTIWIDSSFYPCGEQVKVIKKGKLRLVYETKRGWGIIPREAKGVSKTREEFIKDKIRLEECKIRRHEDFIKYFKEELEDEHGKN